MNKSKWLKNFRNTFLTHTGSILDNKRTRKILIDGVNKKTPLYKVVKNEK